MSATARGLLGVFAIGLLAGAAAIGASVAWDDAWTEIVRQFWVVFGAGGWGWLAKVAAMATGVALALTLAEVALGIRRSGPRTDFDSLHTGNVQEALAEVRRRIADCTAQAPDVVAAFKELVRGAVKVGASDIHVSPTPDALRLTYRVHGTLHEVASLDPSVQAPLVTRIKVLARLGTYVKNSPRRASSPTWTESIEARRLDLPTEGGSEPLRLVRGSQAVSGRVEESWRFGKVLAQLVGVVNRPQAPVRRARSAAARPPRSTRRSSRSPRSESNHHDG